ncbi:MAG TPA: hypothetical protein VMP01_27325 [Pirellulaceae bacterium]|nr:hypothetical protein [Pirellulaceae bacterium]
MQSTDCVSEARTVPGLKPRRLKGLRRPTKTIAGLGTIELAQEDGCHSWQLSHPFVPSRLTLVDDVLRESEPNAEADAVSFLARLLTNERPLRERAIRARYFEFIDESARPCPFDVILENLDEWMAPYRIERFGSSGTHLKYDCRDAPNQALVGAEQIQVALDGDWSIDGVSYFTSGVADHLRIAAYRQRVVPQGCGFAADCIADRFIINTYITPTPELATLLDQSIEQTAVLLEGAAHPHKPFLRCAHSMLCDVRTSRFRT